MGNLDLKYYWAVFLRRLPYFAVMLALLSAIGLTMAFILPPVFVSRAAILVEPQQIPDELAQSTAPTDPYEQIQIIQRRVMTRANLLELADKVGLYADDPDAPSEAIIKSMARRITFTGAEPEEVGRFGPMPGAIVMGVAFEAPTAQFAARGANEVVSLIMAENQRIRTGRVTDTANFFEAEVEQLAAALERKSREIAEFKTANVESLPDSLEARRQQQVIEQERLLALEREEQALANERSTVIWVFERTGRTGTVALSPEEEQLEALKSERLQQLAVYAPGSARIRVLDTRIAALEALVEQQRAERTVPVPDGEGGATAAAPSSELDLELAPIDARLGFIAEEKAMIEQTLAGLQESIAVTPTNEMVLGGLERDLDNLQQQYEAATTRLAQAETGERIERSSKGERFTLVEPPVEPPSPDSPNRRLIAGAGVAGGLGAGLGLVLLLEMLNRSIRRPVDLTAGLGIQPLATIPYIRTRRETIWRRVLITGTLAAIFVVIPLILFLIHTYYMPLDLLLEQIKGAADAAPGA